MRKVLVTGACGFVASNLIDQLLKRGYQVRGCDIVPARRSDIEFMQVDLRDLAKLTQACEGCDTVFHTAAALYKGTAELITSVNVNGTKNVIDACAAAGVKRLVYTSSSSVAFDGGDVINGTEDKYGQPSWFFSDHYAQTKGIAEKLVLAANGKNGLLTAAIRPANIYGPGDRHAFPEIAAKAKMLFATMGPGTQRITPTFVDNCNYGHILAAEALADPKKAATVGGQAYNINDGEDVNFFNDFMFKVGSEVAGVPRKKMGVIRVPFFFIYTIAAVAEAVTKPFGIHLTLSRFAMTVICRNRIFSIEKAKRDLGYEPIVPLSEGLRLSIAASKKAFEEQKAAAPIQPRPKLSWWLLGLSMASSLGLVQALLGDVKYVQKTQFNLVPDQVTHFATRTFALWTFTTFILRISLSFSWSNKTLFRTAYMSFLGSLFFYLGEIFHWKSISLVPNALPIFFFAGTSLTWMTLAPPKLTTTATNQPKPLVSYWMILVALANLLASLTYLPGSLSVLASVFPSASAGQVSPLSARFYSIWSITTFTIRMMYAFDSHNSAMHKVTFASFIMSFGFYLLEVLKFGTTTFSAAAPAFGLYGVSLLFLAFKPKVKTA